MGREPNLLELGLFSVMWSEHCSYKSSRVHLKTLPTSGPRVVQGPGENAGAVDIGDGLCRGLQDRVAQPPVVHRAVPGRGHRRGRHHARHLHDGRASGRAAERAALRIARHAAGTGGCFAGVVAGIGGYGNSIGIPTVGGEIVFDEMYAGNPLVNVLCLGIARHRNDIIKGAGEGHRQSGLLRWREDRPRRHPRRHHGIGGIRRRSRPRSGRPCRSATPSWRSCCMEACLEVMKTGRLVGIQDMGAAGLTCSPRSEMAFRGGCGMERGRDARCRSARPA